MKDYRQIDGMIKQMDECLHHAYDRGYNKGIADGNINDGTFAKKVSEAYENGLRDAWNCSAKLFGYMNEMDIAKIFPQEWKQGGYWELMKLDPKDAIKKVRDFENEVKIEIGDEICLDSGEIGVMVKHDDKGQNATFLLENGDIFYSSEHVMKGKRTGRHYEIDKILNQMQR